MDQDELEELGTGRESALGPETTVEDARSRCVALLR